SKSSQGFGSKVGGWVFGRWGATPTPTATTTTTTSSTKASSAFLSQGKTIATAPKPPSRSSTSSTDPPPLPFDPEATPKKFKIRPPGINQSGPIMGFGPEVRVQPHGGLDRVVLANGMPVVFNHGATSFEFKYNLGSGKLMVDGNLADELGGAMAPPSLFATWKVAVSSAFNANPDLSEVTRAYFEFSGRHRALIFR
ncbi:hypothetical protein B0A55_13106, partial [Friedmanniomyces simplex]